MAAPDLTPVIGSTTQVVQAAALESSGRTLQAQQVMGGHGPVLVSSAPVNPLPGGGASFRSGGLILVDAPAPSSVVLPSASSSPATDSPAAEPTPRRSNEAVPVLPSAGLDAAGFVRVAVVQGGIRLQATPPAPAPQAPSPSNKQD